LIDIRTDHISVVLDLVRLDQLIIQTVLPNVYLVGKEVDLLEHIRRTEKKDEMTFNLVGWHAIALNISSVVLNRISKQAFIDYKMMEINDDRKVVFLYSSTKEVYEYGIKRFKECLDEKECSLIEYLVKSTIRPVVESELKEILDLFEKPLREPIETLLVENNMLRPFEHKGEHYFVSPRIYKDEDKFRLAYEILEDEGLSNITTFIKDNPGNPQSVVQTFLDINQEVINLINQSGIADPLRLNVAGDTKSYLFSPDASLNREDKDHFDFVKTTLANFRFGEYYSKKAQLNDLDAFLSSMIDRGFAGWAEPIGTDYKNLERAGIVKVRRVAPNRYRFWMLKEDVIRDAREILRGYIPIQSNASIGNLGDIDTIVKTRSLLRPPKVHFSLDKITQALRHIQEGII